jgi:hypothetical protein
VEIQHQTTEICVLHSYCFDFLYIITSSFISCFTIESM